MNVNSMISKLNAIREVTMRIQLTSLIVSGLCVCFLLVLLAACGAPIPSSLSQESRNAPVVVVTAKATVVDTDFSEQSIKSLVAIGEEGSFQPGLAKRWNASTTPDGRAGQIIFVLPYMSDAENPGGVSNIARTLQEALDRFLDDSCADCDTSGAGTNPVPVCVTPSPTPSHQEYVPEIGYVFPGPENNSLSVIATCDEASEQKNENACIESILNLVASVPLFDETYDPKWRTDDGRYVFDNSSGRFAYDPETHATKPCTGSECEKKDPGKITVVTCTPTPTSTPVK